MENKKTVKEYLGENKAFMHQSGTVFAEGRKYIKDPSQAPEGANVQKGKRGGYYYDTGAGKGSPDKPEKPSGEAEADEELEILKQDLETAKQIGDNEWAAKIKDRIDGLTPTDQAAGATNFKDVNFLAQNMTPFTEDDWNLLAGAERKDTGEEPKVFYDEADGSIYVEDKHGLTLMTHDENSEQTGDYRYNPDTKTWDSTGVLDSGQGAGEPTQEPAQKEVPQVTTSKSGHEIDIDNLSPMEEQGILAEGSFTHNGTNVRARKNMSGYTEWDATIETADGMEFDIGDNEGGEISLGEIADLVDQAKKDPEKFMKQNKQFYFGGEPY